MGSGGRLIAYLVAKKLGGKGRFTIKKLLKRLLKKAI